jgi:hypothetical protein
MHYLGSARQHSNSIESAWLKKRKKKEDYRSFLWPFSCTTLLVASLALKE